MPNPLIEKAEEEITSWFNGNGEKTPNEILSVLCLKFVEECARTPETGYTLDLIDGARKHHEATLARAKELIGDGYDYHREVRGGTL